MRGQRHAPAAPYPRERPGAHFTGSWMGLRAGPDRCGKSRPHRDSTPGPPRAQVVAIPTTLPGPQLYCKQQQIATCFSYIKDRYRAVQMKIKSLDIHTQNMPLIKNV